MPNWTEIGQSMLAEKKAYKQRRRAALKAFKSRAKAKRSGRKAA